MPLGNTTDVGNIIAKKARAQHLLVFETFVRNIPKC